MTDAVLSAAFDALKALAADLWRRTSAYLDMERESRAQLHELKLNTALIHTLMPRIDADAADVLQQLGREATDLQQRIQAKIVAVLQSTGATKAKKVVTTWWSASSEREDLKDIILRLKSAVQQLIQTLGVAESGIAVSLYNNLSKPAQLAWGNSGQEEVSWNAFVATCAPANTVDVKSLLNVENMVHLTDFTELIQIAGFPFDNGIITQEVNRLRDSRLNFAVSDPHAVVFSQLGLQERLMLCEHLELINTQWVALGKDVQKLTAYAESLETVLGYHWPNFWALSLREQLKNDLGEDCKRNLADMRRTLNDIELHELPAAEVNDCRHRWLHLFTRYMMFWRLTHVSFDVFFAIDFPGKSRVIRTIEVLEPLDEANLRVVIGRMRNETGQVWTKGWPEVYRFLRVWLVAHGVENIPNRICAGGWRIPGAFDLQASP